MTKRWAGTTPYDDTFSITAGNEMDARIKQSLQQEAYCAAMNNPIVVGLYEACINRGISLTKRQREAAKAYEAGLQEKP